MNCALHEKSKQKRKPKELKIHWIDGRRRVSDRDAANNVNSNCRARKRRRRTRIDDT